MTSRSRRSSGRPLGIDWTIRARDDLKAIGDYIARDNPAAADRWVSKLLTAVERTSAMPLSGRVVPELGKEDIREVLLRRYRIVYRVAEKGIVVLTIFEGHRLFPGAEGGEREQ